MTLKKEFLRQFVHLIYWPFIVVLHFNWFLTNNVLFLLIFLTLILSYLIKNNYKIPFFYSFLANVERENDFKRFPLEWFFYFTLSCAALFIIFDKKIWIAYTSIAILCTLDAISTLIWKKYWKHKWNINPNKSIEWSIGWFFAAIFWAYFIWISYDINIFILLITCLLATLIEVPEIDILWFKLNDNITIPIASAVILNFLPLILLTWKV